LSLLILFDFKALYADCREKTVKKSSLFFLGRKLFLLTAHIAGLSLQVQWVKVKKRNKKGSLQTSFF
jgi:hypothetical protein